MRELTRGSPNASLNTAENETTKDKTNANYLGICNLISNLAP